jgi:uncharacterized membrane protein
VSGMASFTLYDLSLFVHITAAVVGFGAAFAQSLTFPLAMQLDVRHLPYVHRLHLAINQRLVSPALLVVLLTGIYQVIDGDWGFDAPWVGASFLIVLVIGGLTGGYLVPAERRLEAEVQDELGAAGADAASLSPEYQRQARRIGGISALTGLLVVVAIFLMVTKPGA